MPAAPEVRDARRGVGMVEVLAEAEAEHRAESDRHVGVAGEVKVDLQRVGEQPDPGRRGGERAAVARALITSPKIILADEPTGALDSRSTDELLRLFAEVNRQGQTILMVTHSARAASRAGRVLFIRDGEVFHQLYRGDMTDDLFYQKIADTLTLLAQGGDRA